MQEIQEVETEHVSWTSWSMRKRLLRSLDSRRSDRGDGIKRLFVLPLSILCHSPLSKRLFLFKLTSFVYYVHLSLGSVRFLSTFFIFTSYFPWAAPLKFSFCVDPHKRSSSFVCNFIVFSLIINYIIMFCLQGDPSRLIKSDHAVHK